MRAAPKIDLTMEERTQLEQWTRSTTAAIRLVTRCRIVLLAAEGLENLEIAQRLGVGRVQAGRWRSRFAQDRVKGIERDQPRSGRGKTIDEAEIVRLTTQTTPENATHWSTRKMAQRAGVSETTVRRVWRNHGLKPHRIESFKVSRDPKFVEKLEDVVGLYLNPPEHALVLSCDEKSQIQALDRTQPGLPLKKGRAGTMTHDYKRHGTTTLFAALNTLDGTVISCCQQRHRNTEWLKFLRRIDRQTPKDKQLHLICDNYSAHKHENVQKWLTEHPRFHIHFTPTSASWLNMVERLFRTLSTDRLKRGVFRSIPELVATIEDFIAKHNQNPKPFVWTAKAQDILEKVIRANRKLSARKNDALH
jgi:transposase